VRLKVAAMPCSIASITFQFLLVRLKVCLNKHLISITIISIPFGAIKSGNKMKIALKNYEISIPFGAIKSGNKMKIALKNYEISIPFGAIKSP